MDVEGGRSSTNFVRRHWVREVKYLDVSARSPDDENLVLHVHCVTPVLEFYCGQRSGRSKVPVLDSGRVFPASVTMCWEKKEETKQRIELGGKRARNVPLVFCPSCLWQGFLPEPFQTTSRI